MRDFNSQICTTREQSERLIALGLKKETADMCHFWHWESGDYSRLCASWELVYMSNKDIPAWSLHRLIEMMPEKIDAYPINLDDDIKETYYLSFNKWLVNYKCNNVYKECHESINLFSNIISMYEWLIKEGYFNKEYLEE